MKTHNTKNSLISLYIYYKRNFLNLVIYCKKKSGNHYNPSHLPIRYGSFLLHYFPIYAYITTCHSYACSRLSLLLSCEILSGRSSHCSISIPIITPCTQNLLSIGFFFQSGQEEKRERNNVLHGMVLCYRK